MSKKDFLTIVAMAVVAVFLLSIKFPVTSGEAQYPPPPYPTPTIPPTDPPEGFPLANIVELLGFVSTAPQSPTFPTIRLDFGKAILWYIQLPPAAGSSYRGTWFKDVQCNTFPTDCYCEVAGLYYEDGNWYEETPTMLIADGNHHPESLVNPRIDCDLNYTPPGWEYVYVSSTATDHPKYIYSRKSHLPLSFGD